MKHMYVPQEKKNENYLGKIDVTALMLKRAGKVSGGTVSGLGVKVHKSEKDYDRKREKQKLKKQLSLH